jgi:hypothetical protein
MNQLLFVIDQEKLYFGMEMIDHQQDASEIHLVYCKTLHPRIVSLSTGEKTRYYW